MCSEAISHSEWDNTAFVEALLEFFFLFKVSTYEPVESPR